MRRSLVAALSAGSTIAVAAAAVAAAGAAAPSFPLPAATAGASKAGGVLVRQDATLTAANRATGMPTTSDPSRQLERATVEIETYGQDTPEPSYFIEGSVQLAGIPSGDPDAEVNLGFGHQEGSSCQLAAVIPKETSDYDGSTYYFTGYNPDYFPSPSRPWDCLAAYVDDSFSGGPATVTHDAFVGPLIDTRQSPRLAITRVDLLGQKQKSLKLVRGIPTEVGISLRNSGKVATGRLTAKGSGKGVRVAARKLDPIAGERDGSTSVKVRLTGRQKRTKVRIVVTDGSSRAVRTLRVTRAKPPRRPAAGRYRSRAGDVDFMVRKGRIVGWRGSMTTRCGGFPDPFTYTRNTYSFRTVKVPRNGIVQAVERGSLYTAALRLRIAGRKVTRGLFSYYGPDRCFASATFKARRTGR